MIASNYSERPSKVKTPAEALADLAAGATLALGGMTIHNEPAGLVRYLIKRSVSQLTLIPPPSAAYCVDLLIGVGAVKRIYAGHVSFEHMGLAPNFRQAGEAGTVDIVEANEALIVGGLLAAAQGVPAHPVQSLAFGDIGKSSGLVKRYRDEDGEELVAVKALKPDLALIHAQQADPFGNIRHLGATFADRIMARAARKAVVSVDELISPEQTRKEPWRTTIPGYMVDAVVLLPWGAHPAASHGKYNYDEDHLRHYLACARSRRKDKGSESWADYLQDYVYGPDDFSQYLERLGGEEKLSQLKEGVVCGGNPSLGKTI
jgi:glutaconate CoA-transferase subunit A